MPAITRGDDWSVSDTGQSRTQATIAMKLAVERSIATERQRAPRGCSINVRTDSSNAATATSGAAKNPAKPSSHANAIDANAMPCHLRRAASVMPYRIHGTS